MGISDDRFWAGFLGVEATDWMSAGVSVRPHAGLLGYRGFWCFRRRERLVISAPAAWISRLTEIASGRAPKHLMAAEFWAQALSSDFERAVGPAFQGCLEPAMFNRRPSGAVRPVGALDKPAVEELRASCGSDWNMPDDARLWRHAYFEDGLITSLAGYRAWSDTAGDPCVITRPDARGGGRGAAVTSAVVAAALADQKLLLYQTLESNAAAVRIALSLGFERYANHLAVRLCRDSPSS